MTRRQLGWAYLGVGAAVLAAPQLMKLSAALVARSVAKMTPAPVATIEHPRAGATIGADVVVEGTAVHETIRAPLWLLSSEGGRDWRPEGELATGTGAWRRQIYLRARKGTRVRLAVVAAEIPLHNAFKKELAHPDGPPWMLEPEWRAIAHERWMTANLGDAYPPLPGDARLVGSVDVVQGENEPTTLRNIPLPILLRRMKASTP